MQENPFSEGRIVKPDKLLSEWTLGEMKKFCGEIDCTACPYGGKDETKICMFLENCPVRWHFPIIPAESETQPKPEKTKPHLAEILGVEAGERFGINVDGKPYGDFYVDDEGIMWLSDGDLAGYADLCTAINHPEKIVCKPRFTEQELAICRAVGARYVTRSDNTCNNNFVIFWNEKPELHDGLYIGESVNQLAIIFSNSGLFTQSVKPGECIEVDGGIKE